MTRVVIVGEIYNADLQVGGGPMPGGPGRPVDPGYSPPWARPGGGPVDPGYSPPWARPGGGPVDPGYGIDAGLRPTHPIYNPAYPDNTLPQPPLGTWGPNDPRPTPPIYLGPEVPAPEPPPEKIIWRAAWTPTTGWVTVGIPQVPAPTPSAG